MSLHRTAAVLIGALLVCSSVSLAIGATPVAAQNESVSESTISEDGPAYGVNSSDFYRRSRPSASGLDPEAVHKLWSDDIDDAEIPCPE